MDLLSKRYASPYFLLNGVIRTGRLEEFVDELGEILTEEKNDEAERMNWEFFIHKVHDKSYSEFREEIRINEEHQNMSDGTIETTLQHTQNILNGFNPEQGGE